MKKRIRIIILFILAISGKDCICQDIYDAAHSRAYGDYLYKSKEYLKASMEYERSCFLDSQNWDTHFKLLQSYRKSGQASKAISHFYWLNHRLPIEQLFVFEHEKNICVFETEPLVFITKQEKDSIAELKYFKAPALLLTHDWNKSKNYLISINFKEDKTLGKYYENNLQGLNLNYKKPWLAGSMSAVVPGLGKVYSGYYKDGIIAFIMTGLSAFQAYRGYNAKGPRSGIFIIYTGVASGFYLGNIYGSIKSARQKNRKLNEQIDKKTMEIFYEWTE